VDARSLLQNHERAIPTLDPITHGLLGATLAKASLGKRLPRGAALIGAASAMAPDVDVFIWSTTDPTIGWIYHRHFTHALVAIPLGGLLCALPFLLREQFKPYRIAVILATMIGYGSHTMLDSLTTYGTQQLLPFADTRVTWDAMPIVDPLYSLILIAGLVLSARMQRLTAVRWSLALSLLYVAFGFWQHHRAASVQQSLLVLRNHQPTQSRVLPAPGWLVYWRSIYVADGKLYADGIRLPWLRAGGVLAGGSAAAITLGDLPPATQANAEAVRQFKVFDWFTGSYVAPIAGSPNAVGDMRIVAGVENLQPLWGLQFKTDGAPERWEPTGNVRRGYGELLRGLLFGDERYKP
jgi:inner membrane protein